MVKVRGGWRARLAKAGTRLAFSHSPVSRRRCLVAVGRCTCRTVRPLVEVEVGGVSVRVCTRGRDQGREMHTNSCD